MHSYTEIRMARRCLKKYEYSRVRNLEPITSGWRPSFGSWMHSLIETRDRGDNWYATHDVLIEVFEAEVLPFTDDEEVLAIPELAVQVMERYVQRYPHEDWEVLHIEESFDISGIGITPDLVVRTPGGIWVVDRKTSASIPNDWDLAMDTQIHLYVYGMRQIYGEEVKGAMFDFIRSRVPTEPRLNKTIKRDLGHVDINNVKAIDTDYETLLNFAADNGVPPYPALTERLAQLKDEDRYFRRIPILVNGLAAAQTYEEALDTMIDLETRDFYPRTVLGPTAGGQSCAGCPFRELCHAELFGLNTDSAMMMYRERTPLGREYQEVNHE